MSSKIKLYRGRGMTREELDSGAFSIAYWKTELRYSWSTGVAIGRFLEELKNGRLIGRRCDKCRRILVPPRMFCEDCFRPTDSWVFVKDTGTVKTFSISYVAADASRLKKPLIVAVIDINGASKGMGILHLLSKVDPKDVYVGMRVKAVWKPITKRAGAITDIIYFKPLDADA